jgi:hypothetical protein
MVKPTSKEQRSAFCLGGMNYSHVQKAVSWKAHRKEYWEAEELGTIHPFTHLNILIHTDSFYIGLGYSLTFENPSFC